MSLGLERDVVRIELYDQLWPQAFADEAALLRRELRVSDDCVEHVGSTAVPGLIAKPIIDIIVGLASLNAVEEMTSLLGKVGYVALGDRRKVGDFFFAKGIGRNQSHYLHLVELGGRSWTQYLTFRDRLRADPMLRMEYALLKVRSSERFAYDRPAYVLSKEPFISRVISTLGCHAHGN